MKQSLRMLLRDWRAGELRILALALVVAVASITSVAFPAILSLNREWNYLRLLLSYAMKRPVGRTGFGTFSQKK